MLSIQLDLDSPPEHSRICRIQIFNGGSGAEYSDIPSSC